MFNYKALGLNVPLNSKIVLSPESLENFINSMGGAIPLYHCYYELEKRESYVDYDGELKLAWNTIHIDLDSEEDLGEAAWSDTKALCKKLQEEKIPFHVYFSGNKGFHVAIHASALGLYLMRPQKKPEMERDIKAFVNGLKEFYPTVDLRIWNANRKFRAYRSLHEKTGLYKTRLTDAAIESPSSMTLEEIRALAKTQQSLPMKHPLETQPNVWLMELKNRAAGAVNLPTNSKAKVKEVAVGTTVEDESLRLRNFDKKVCVKEMKDRWLPQFNRHDIGLRLMVDFRDRGFTIDKAENKILEWAGEVFSEPDRIKDTLRQLKDVYAKPQEYKFGCYDDIKKAYCSGQCKLYNSLDRNLRAKPVDLTQKQLQQNEEANSDSISEGQLADRLLREIGQVCKVSGDYFRWTSTHWERIDKERFEYMMNEFAIHAYDNKASSKKIASLVTQIRNKIPVAPESNHFYSASLNKFNFTDCTATVEKTDQGNLTISYSAHNPDDFLAYCAPFPIQKANNLPRSGEFHHYLQTRLEDVGDEGLRTIKQMLGAALIPYIPRIFFIVGITNSGKSTLALLIKKLLGPQNVSEVPPVKTGMGGDRFNWEPSIGKLANIVLELDTQETLDVNTLKKVRDKSAVSVDRKGLKKVDATLPFLHIYCCNELPPSLEGNTGALNNRVSMLYFKPGYLNGLGGITELANHLWERDAGSILDVAREGLADLVAQNFKYHDSEDSKANVKEWQKGTDPVMLFVEDAQKGEWQIHGLAGHEFEKGSVIYESYVAWSRDAGRPRPIGKHKFYKQFRQKFNVECQERGKGGVTFKVKSLFDADESRF